MSASPRFAARAVLFDLDGTLIDTAPDLAVAAERTFADLGRPPRAMDDIRRFVGKGIPHLMRRSLSEGMDQPADEAEIERAVNIFREHYAEVNGLYSRVYPGILDTLKVLREQGRMLACVTNKTANFTLPLLHKLALDEWFDTVVSGDTLPVKKPDPAMLHHACEHFGLAPQQALMVGDSANDADAARAAAMPVLLVTYGYSEGMPVDTIECDGLISNAYQVLNWVTR